MGPEQPNLGCILETIRREIADSNVRFVFPSEIAAGLWAQKTCVLGLARSVAVNRFLAWDRFKEEAVRAESQEKEPVSKAVRKLFAENLLERNVKEGLFQALVLPEFADQGSVFAPQIAAMLPALRALGERRTLAGPGYQSDDEDQDFALLEREYGAFLDRHRLFEPAWERPPLKDREHRYYIFFPEAIDDFAEYEATLIAEAETIHIMKVDTAGSPPPFRRFGSSSEEIRVAALELRRLHDEEGIPFTDMAISVPGLEDLEPYLLRELTLYDIPVRRRSGRPLAEQGAGRLFSLIQTCVQQNFSFAALKSLILNDRIPWRYPELNRRLIDFGIGHNCVSAYREGGELKDIWREAFRGAGPETATLHRYYEGLSRALRRMSGAGDFEAIRRGYFAFRGPSWEKAGDHSTAGTTAPGYPGEFRSFLSRDRLSDEGDAVLARCVEELSALIRLKEDFPDLAVRSPFGFYLSTLKEIQYVPAGQKPGLNLFPYRTAAAAPFSCHFVLNASQSAATVLYEPLSFLGQDKRRALGLADTDASGAFFRLYGSIDRDGRTGPAEISAADETYSGWTIPHSFFAGQGDTKTVDGGTLDPFALERNWWAYRQDGAGRDTAAAFPMRIYPVQRTGFDNWYFPLAEKRAGEYNLFAGAFPRAMPAFEL
ncbi:MAG: hypothetical protein LBT11_06610 [Treponema sp.]|nr:hypothetical protein [Treponema sp.]